MFRRTAKKKGLVYPIRHARDGADGLRQLAEMTACWPIVFLDINMPGLDGHEFLKAVRDDPALSSTVVFVLTTSRHDRDVKQAYERNVAGYFNKEDLSELLEMITIYADRVGRPRPE